MTYTTYYRRPHPPVYYTVRTFVRCVFWTLVMFGFIMVASWISRLGSQPKCPIVLNSDFTYTVVSPFDLTECSAGPNVTLQDNGRWEWTE